mmetsp:Transcript_22976/g.46148  ORF Transcript_22976/g.46148 Transcript_22976/m.46148 type:complete len:141 (-) Transcript_22976:165-587(-)
MAAERRRLGCCWWCLCSCGDELPEIEAKDLLALTKTDEKEDISRMNDSQALPQILDVRNGFEYRGGHIRGARHCQYLLPCDFVSRVEAMSLDAGRPVYVICLSAHRSIGAVRALQSIGFDARHLRGGMQAWRKEKYPESK